MEPAESNLRVNEVSAYSAVRDASAWDRPEDRQIEGHVTAEVGACLHDHVLLQFRITIDTAVS
jgi:hypothetical protein